MPVDNALGERCSARGVVDELAANDQRRRRNVRAEELTQGLKALGWHARARAHLEKGQRAQGTPLHWLRRGKLRGTRAARARES